MALFPFRVDPSLFCRRALTALALVALAPGAVRGQDAFPLAEAPAVKALIDEALARNPEILATRERTAAMASDTPSMSRAGSGAAASAPAAGVATGTWMAPRTRLRRDSSATGLAR